MREAKAARDECFVGAIFLSVFRPVRLVDLAGGRAVVGRVGSSRGLPACLLACLLACVSEWDPITGCRMGSSGGAECATGMHKAGSSGRVSCSWMDLVNICSGNLLCARDTRFGDPSRMCEVEEFGGELNGRPGTLVCRPGFCSVFGVMAVGPGIDRHVAGTVECRKYSGVQEKRQKLKTTEKQSQQSEAIAVFPLPRMSRRMLMRMNQECKQERNGRKQTAAVCLRNGKKGQLGALSHV